MPVVQDHTLLWLTVSAEMWLTTHLPIVCWKVWFNQLDAVFWSDFARISALQWCGYSFSAVSNALLFVGIKEIWCVYCLATSVVFVCPICLIFLSSLPLFLFKIELEEQRRTGRGRAKESKRKRKNHRGGSGDGARERSLDASESKKTCPLSLSRSPHLPTQTSPEVLAFLSVSGNSNMCKWKFLWDKHFNIFFLFDRFCDEVNAGAV